MITATLVREKLKTMKVCDGLDGWIEEYLVPKFFSKNKVSISDSITGYGGYGWKKEDFLASMQIRGFHVSYICEDNPCGGCYFEITLPPGEE
jgi:hypothetical protein